MELTTENLLQIDAGKIYDAEIICDSVNSFGARLITAKLNIWRPVLAEFDTHRMFSRNAPSSRALSVKSLLKKIKENPAMPVWWGKRTGPGMQAFEHLNGIELELVKEIWENTKQYNIETAEKLYDLGLHQQISNRIIEPWMLTTVLVTSTSWKNFFDQRVDVAAQPEFHVAAARLKQAIENSIPVLCDVKHKAHLPFISKSDYELYLGNDLEIDELFALSVARCARVSYFQYDGSFSLDKDFELHDKLKKSKPMHASPFEHQAIPMFDLKRYYNLTGWRSYRYEIEYDSIKDISELYDGPTMCYDERLNK